MAAVFIGAVASYIVGKEIEGILAAYVHICTYVVVMYRISSNGGLVLYFLLDSLKPSL